MQRMMAHALVNDPKDESFTIKGESTLLITIDTRTRGVEALLIDSSSASIHFCLSSPSLAEVL